MTVLSTQSPTKAKPQPGSPNKNSGSPKKGNGTPIKSADRRSPPKGADRRSPPKVGGGGSPNAQRGLKRKLSTPSDSSQKVQKCVRLQRPKRPVGEAWPVQDLRAFDPPADPVLRDVLKARGWLQSLNPCPGTYGPKTGVCTFFAKEFKATSQKAIVNTSQAGPRPQHALWFLGKTPCNGTKESLREREDFVKLVVQQGEKLPGKSGNYRIAKFPATEALLCKTHVTEAFKNKPWYPATYFLPKDKASLTEEIRSRGDSRNNFWMVTSQNDASTSCLWKGTDTKFAKVVRESEWCPRATVQQCIADPLLIGGFKFHMRIHLVITNLSPLEAFVHENGQCLFASKPHNLSSKTVGDAFDPAVHLTNMDSTAKPEAMDNYFKKNPTLGHGRQQIGIRQLVAYLTDNYPSFKRHSLWQQILSIAGDTTSYLAKGVQRHNKIVRDRHFEIFGLDLAMDKDFKVWMLNVDTDPVSGHQQKDVAPPFSITDGQKDFKVNGDLFHDVFALLGLDSGRKQSQGSLQHWFKLDA